MDAKAVIKKIKHKYSRITLFFKEYFGISEGMIVAVVLLVAIFAVGAVAGRPSKKRALTKSPLLWAKLDSSLTDEVSAGDTFAYSPGKPSSELGITIKEGDNIQYSRGVAIDAGSGIYENWNPNQGTMNVWVQPNWNGADNRQHWIWSADAGRIDTTDANLKAYWKFDEGSENFAFDSSSNSNVGYLHGPGLSFDGSSDYVNCGNGSGLNLGTGDFSIEFWSKLTDNNAIQSIMVKSDESLGSLDSKGFDILYRSDHVEKDTQFRINDGSGTSSVSDLTSINLGDGLWHHSVIAADRSGNAQWYVDGAPYQSSSIAGDTGGIDVSNNLYIGTDSIYINWFLSGIINNVRIYNRALSATEVANHYAGRYTDETGLIGYWPMDENQGQTVADKSGNGNDGTLGADSGESTDDPAWVDYAPSWTEEGRFGKALKFDGMDDEADLGDINF